MKYLTIFLLSFVLASPALAAKQVPGEVPVFQPLQPTPPDTAPNFGHNVQNSDPAHPLPSSHPSGQSDSYVQPSKTAEVVIPGITYQKTENWYWWLAVTIVFFVGIFWIIQKLKK